MERGVVSSRGVGVVGYNYNGLGEVDGLFNIGKMFTRMFTFTPQSFKMKNIAGAIGSATMAIGSGGLMAFAPKTLSAKSKVAKGVGYGAIAAGIAVGAYYGGSALLPLVTGGGGAAAGAGAGAGALTTAGTTATTAVTTGGGFLSTVGAGLSTVGGWLGTGLKVLTGILPAMGAMGGGGGGGQQQQQGGMTQAEYDAQMAAQAKAQAEYDAQVRAQQQQMYQPGVAYNIPGEGYMQPVGYTGQPSMNTSYGDLRSPYTAVTEDGQTVQVDPNTGQVVQPGMSTPMMIAVGGVTLLAGWYLLSGSKSIN